MRSVALPKRLVVACALFTVAAVIVLAPAPTGARGDAERPDFRIRRDGFGVPHIYASTDIGLYFGAGYAAGQDRLFQLELYRRSALGRLAEVFGPTLVEADRLERQRGYTAAEYQAQIDALPAASRARIGAYADGISAAISEAIGDPAGKLPYEFHVLGFRPEPWTVRDTLAVTRFTVRRFGEFGGNELRNQADYQALEQRYGSQTESVFNDWFWRLDPKSPTTISSGAVAASAATKDESPADVDQTTPSMRFPGIERLAADIARRTAAAEAGWASVGMPKGLGSFAMVVAPSRSASGHPLIYYGPQMGFEYPDVIYEQHLVGGDGGRYDLYGVGVPGLVGPAIGQNRQVAWGFTSGYADNIDLFAERLNPERPEQYFHNGAWRTAEVRAEPIDVRTSPIGQPVTTIRLTNMVTRTVHGPVIAADPGRQVAFAERREMWMQEAAFLSVDLLTADSLEAFGKAVADFPASFNILAATADGHIGYWHASHIAERADGSYSGRFPWPGDGSADWRAGHRPLASIIDPPQGWLANWNNRPDATFANGDSTRFGTQHRVERVFELLAAKDRASREDLDGIAKDMAVLNPFNGPGRNADHLIGPMLAAVRQAAPGDSRLGEVASRLAAWDGHFASDAVSGTLVAPEYTIWNEWWPLAATAVFSDEWGAANLLPGTQHLIHAFEGPAAGVPPSRNYFDDGSTPEVVETAPQLMSASLRQTLDLLTARFGSSEVDRWTTVRGVDEFRHPLLGTMGPSIPRSNRSTWTFIAEPGSGRPSQSLVPSGTSAFIRLGPGGAPVIDRHAFDQRLRFARWDYKSTNAPPWLLFVPSLRRD